MLGWVVLCLLTLRFHRSASQGECTDNRGRVISHGLHYVPGPETCTLCVCDNGLPKFCKAVLCSPPQDCRSFRVGTTCCEFICLDDVVKPAEGAEANVRVAAGGAAAIVLLTVALVVYRVRKQKRRRAPHTDDQRSLTSIGYISGSMRYMDGTCETALASWKPPGNYLPRGEAPPPYDEVVAQCRQESARFPMPEVGFHRSYPSAMEALPRSDDTLQCSTHVYTNIPRPMQQVPNTQTCYNAPLLQPVHPPESWDPNSMPHHPLAANLVGFPSAIRLTGSLGAISNRGLLSLLQRERESERPGLYPPSAPMHSLHRTIPRMSPAEGLPEFGLPLGAARRSFHLPPPRRAPRAAAPAPAAPAPPAAGRSVPRNLNIAADSPATIHRAQDTLSILSAPGMSSAPVAAARSRSASSAPDDERPAPHAPHAPHAPQTLPTTVDKPSCVCSYAGGATGPAGAGGAEGDADGAEGEGEDDFRSECENCQAANNSRWAVEAEGGGWCGAEAGSQTLQRAPPAAPPAAPATATLPQPVTKQRTIIGPPSNWDNWFNTIPDSDSESEEE